MTLLPPDATPGTDLPVRAAVPGVVAALGRGGMALLVAPPGSGKTSLLPLAVADALPGRVVVAEPRRIATRAAADRLAGLLGEKVGARIGYAMRGERVSGSRVEVVTTGLLVRRLQREPDLPGVGAVVIDECHERQLDTDLLLAFTAEVRGSVREDLAVLAMTATPDVSAVRRALGTDVPVVTAAGSPYPVETVWAPPARPIPLRPDGRVDDRFLAHVADVTRRALDEADGDVLVFVPGEREIGSVIRSLGGVVADVLPLFGRQPRAEQDRALTAGPRRRVVVTTAVAESSLTVPGVRLVVDAGLSREPRTDHDRGLSTLVTTKVSRAAADQRRGRAGREGPGRGYRCWSEAEHALLAAHAPAEVATADLSSFALALAAWGTPGGDGLRLPEPPPRAAMAAATELLVALDAVTADGRITARGRALAELGAHPRLARALLDGAGLVGGERARGIVALLSDDGLTGRDDDLARRYRTVATGPDARRWRDERQRLGSGGPPATDVPDDLAVGIVVGLAYPDRLARLRRSGGTSYLTVGGTGAELAADSALRDSPWLAVATATRVDGRADARVRAAAPVDEDTVRLVAAERVRTDDEVLWRDGTLVARSVERAGAIELRSRPLTAPDPLAARAAVCAGLREVGLGVLTWTPSAVSLRERLAFLHAHLGQPWPAVDDEALLGAPDAWLAADLDGIRRERDLGRIDVTAALRRLLPWPTAGRFEELAPERLAVPSGSRVRLQYDGAAPPVLAVKLQETFGWTITPTVADGRVPVLLHLLSPAGRPVAVTADLTSFWAQGYPQVRAELRARYPRHPWPEDPLTASPTARAKPRG